MAAVTYFAANWKMNFGPADARAFMQIFLPAYAPRDGRRVLFFPPAVSLDAVHTVVAARPDVAVGAQNKIGRAHV